MRNGLLQSLYSWIAIVAIVIIVITGNSFYVISTLDNLAKLEARLFNITKVTESITKLHVAILRTESGKRGYLLTRNEQYLSDYTKTLNTLNELLEEVGYKSQELGGKQDVHIDELLSLSKAKLNDMISTVELARNGRFEQAMEIVNSNRSLILYEEFENTYKDVRRRVNKMQNTHLKNLIKLRKESFTTLAVSGASTALLIILIFILLKINVKEAYRHQKELETHNEELEEKINRRTQELQVYSDELARSNRELEDFAFVASHDLQEPLRKIRAFGNRLESGYSDVIDDRGRDFMKRMLNAAERMSMLIRDLLAFSRVATRGKEFDKVDLDNVISNVKSDLEIAIDESEAIVECDKLPVINGDQSQLEQLFLNLLSNALKFRQQDQAPYISIRLESPEEADLEHVFKFADYNWVKIIIKDNGIGFDQTFAEKIFAPFQRLHGRSEYQGTGIGLAVCRRIVERHNGYISAQSSPGTGAVFSIVIPVDGEPFASTIAKGVTEDVA
ncbi:sensor histidine kinase [Alteromonas sp. ASW11-130]|uniref:sensor histidine kinase n=1 Tax=Alteromonas sp. ASW11-130 TaxID=3015775 RepID=UPI00224245B9|nr:sensor histidine kinase [Alteromonas sp. ASW11-130]MCW8090280.1 ATP-binding protein [Alteromonas sp. ASW11-130]